MAPATDTLGIILEDHRSRIQALEETQSEQAVTMEKLNSKFTAKYILLMCALIMLASAMGSGVGAAVLKLLTVTP